jgi:hypothetical protein
MCFLFSVRAIMHIDMPSQSVMLQLNHHLDKAKKWYFSDNELWPWNGNRKCSHFHIGPILLSSHIKDAL